MKYICGIFVFIWPWLVFSQNNGCDCIVRYGFFYNPKDHVEKEIKPFVPKKNQKFAFHQVIKDSSIWWFIKPHVYDSIQHDTIIKIKKQDALGRFMIEIIYNDLDSVPMYSEPTKNAKVLYYIHKSEYDLKHSTPYRNYDWFRGCKNGYVKVMYKRFGWIRKENFIHFEKKKN